MHGVCKSIGGLMCHMSPVIECVISICHCARAGCIILFKPLGYISRTQLSIGRNSEFHVDFPEPSALIPVNARLVLSRIAM